MSTDAVEIQSQLRDLSEKRQRWVDANEENEFSEGINNLLTELYPENAHFIYELLQNAEDVEASNVTFKLQKKRLVVEHDGRRSFTFKDIESITSIGTSTKKDDPTSIGKFGVGFKAVFAYTKTPEIHSGDHHFRIHNLVVPDISNVKRINVGDKTQFIFPFNHPSKNPSLAIEEIRRGLLELPDITLLFLKHISTVKFILPDGRKGFMSRKGESDPIIEIQTSRPHEPDSEISDSHNPNHRKTKTYWLRFTDKVKVADPENNNNLKDCHISLAFQLDRKKKRSKGQRTLSSQGSGSAWKITPIEHGNVSIYFPAIKEISRLRFHINAPFASTVARDSVRECKVNEDLRDHIADLLKRSMTDIRELGLLTPDILGVLPVRDDNLPPFYEPIRKRLINEFRKKPLVPIASGGFKRASKLCTGPDVITSRLDDRELAFLSDYDYLRWAEKPSQNNFRANQFLKDLHIYEWGFSDLEIAAERYFEDDGVEEIVSHWLESQTDEWISDLYSTLNKYRRYHEARAVVEMFPIIRTKSKKQRLIDSKGVFLSVGDQFSSHFEVIDPKVIKNSEAKEYIKSLGFEKFDLKSEVETLILPKYDLPLPEIPFDEHMNDLKKIYKVHNSLYGRLRNETIIKCENKEQYYSGPEVYFNTAELNLYFEGNENARIISSEYNINKNKWIAELFSFLGAEKRKPREIYTGEYSERAYSKNDYHKRGLDDFNPKWFIDELDHALSYPTLERSAYIWNKLILNSVHLIHGIIEECKVAAFPVDRIHRSKINSEAGALLKNKKWIPLKSGGFVVPQNIQDANQIHPKLISNDRLLDALSDGQTSKRKKAAEALGISKEKFDYYLENQEKIEELCRRDEIRESNKQEILSRSIGNREQRDKRMTQRTQDASLSSSNLKMRSVPAQSDIEIDTEALMAYYRNRNDILVCQMCFDPMPFVNKDGKDAVKFVKIFTDKWSKRANIQLKKLTPLKLVLCPVCSDLYQEYIHRINHEEIHVKRDPQSLLFDFLASENDGEYPICDKRVRHDHKDVTLTFNPKHRRDIHVCLKAMVEKES